MTYTHHHLRGQCRVRYEKTRAAGAYLKEHYIDEGKLCRASGEGFYKYAAAGSTAKP